MPKKGTPEYDAWLKKFRTSIKRVTAARHRAKGRRVEQLQEGLARHKKALDRYKKSVSFLSLDVVDSTGMKNGEEPSIVERDFRKYKKMVQRIAAKQKALKSAWTPDGALICFLDVPSALRAARDVIESLPRLNAAKAIHREFSVRAGINYGEVIFHKATPLEDIVSQVIDIAAHMQKCGSANVICAPRHAVISLLAEFPFQLTNRVVDEHPVYEWRIGNILPNVVKRESRASVAARDGEVMTDIDKMKAELKNTEAECELLDKQIRSWEQFELDHGWKTGMRFVAKSNQQVLGARLTALQDKCKQLKLRIERGQCKPTNPTINRNIMPCPICKRPSLLIGIYPADPYGNVRYQCEKHGVFPGGHIDGIDD